MTPNPSLDQLQALAMVVETGSFTAAARALNRAQSAISYAINNLEAQLGLELFERGGAKRPRMTEAGRVIYEDARRILSGLDAMRARVRSLNTGMEAELTVAISVMVPMQAVVSALREFRDRFPSVSLNVTVGELGVVVDQVASGTASLGFGGAAVQMRDAVVTQRIGQSIMVPVAAADHALARLDGELTIADVREEVQLVVADASGLTQGRNFNVLSYRTWRVSDVATKHWLIRGGLGWGGLPLSLVREDLDSGRLVRLDLPGYQQDHYPLFAVTRLPDPPGPAGQWLIDAFRASLAQHPD